MATSTPVSDRPPPQKQQHPEVVTPPAPPGESSPAAVQKTQAVADVLIQLGENATPEQVAALVAQQAGIQLSTEEVGEIIEALRERAKTPPSPDQPPPENARSKAHSH